MKPLLVLALIGAPWFAGTGCASRSGGAPSSALVNQPAPELQLTWLDGVTDGGLESLRGRVVLLEFWRTWCGPCLAEVGHLNLLHERYQADGLVTVAVSNEDEELVRTTAEQAGLRYAVALTSGNLADETYGIRAVPRAFLIDRNGLLVWSGHPATLEEERLRALLAQR